MPVEADFTQILVNKNGNLLALVGKCMVFIVELDPDFWDYRHQIGVSLDFDSSVEHLKSEYYARFSFFIFSSRFLYKLFFYKFYIFPGL